MASSSEKTDTNASPGRFSPEPEFADFEPERGDHHDGWWDGESDRPKTPESADFDISDSDDEHPVMCFAAEAGQDQAERWLRQKRWGLVIYRCTYGDEVRWTQFVKTFEAMGRCDTIGDPKLDATLAFDVRNDEALFQSDDLTNVRRHFETWIHSDESKRELQDEHHQEYNGDADLLHRIRSVQINKSTPAHLASPRYSYFIYVDEAAMESVLAHQNDPVLWRGNNCGWVNVVGIDRPGRPLSVRAVTPSTLYPQYYADLAAGAYGESWEHRPRPPLVDIGDASGYWPGHGTARGLGGGKEVAAG